MKLLCIKGIPDRGLYTGQLYTELARYACCGIKPFPLVSVAESTGRVRQCVCKKCRKIAPRAHNGWYDSRRFIDVDADKEVKSNIIHLFTPSKIVELI